MKKPNQTTQLLPLWGHKISPAIFLGESPWPSGTGCVPNPACVAGNVQQLPGIRASEPAIPHRNPHGCQRWRMAQYVHLITPVNQGQSILLRPPLVNTGNLQLPYNAIKWNEDTRQSGAVSPVMWAGAGPGFLLMCSQACRFYGKDFTLKSNQH